jgi:hypothetical protein
MKRPLGFFQTPLLLTCLLLVSQLIARAEPQDPAEPGYVPERIILTWTGDPTRTQAATWRTEKPAGKPTGEIAPLTSQPEFKTSITTTIAIATTVELDAPDKTANYYSVNFENLTPDSEYCYRVGDADTKTWSEWNVFRTASNKQKPFKFLYLGDEQNHIKSLWSRAIRTAFTRNPDIRCIVHAGDLIQYADNDSQWGDWFYSMGWIAATVPSIPTPGNHEKKDATGGGDKDTLSKFWRPQFALPLNGPKGLKYLEETAYYVDFQGVRFVSVDSNYYRDKQQQNWLAEVLKNNSNQWTIVTHHYPLYSTGREGDKPGLCEALRPIYEKYKVDLVLQGHDHTYGRTHKLLEDKIASPDGPGVIYAVSVSGPKMYDLSPLHQQLMAKMLANTQLYQIIEVSEKELIYTSYSIDGAVVDRFRLVKKAGGTSTYINEAPQP